MKITKRQLRRIIREEYRRFVSRKALNEDMYATASSEDDVWSVDLQIQYDNDSGDFLESWNISRDGVEVQSGNDYEVLKATASEIADTLANDPDERDDIYYAISDVVEQVNDWN